MGVFLDRIVGASKLNVRVYEDVEADPKALGQAMGVVVLSSVAAGIGSIERIGFAGLVIGTLAALAGWYVWAYLTYLIGTKLLPEAQTRSNPGELLRTIGFSSAPGMIRVLGIIPGMSWIFYTIGGIWMLVAMVVAVRQALDYKSTLRAVGVCLIGWVIQALFVALLFYLFGPSNGEIPGS